MTNNRMGPSRMSFGHAPGGSRDGGNIAMNDRTDFFISETDQWGFQTVSGQRQKRPISRNHHEPLLTRLSSLNSIIKPRVPQKSNRANGMKN